MRNLIQYLAVILLIMTMIPACASNLSKHIEMKSDSIQLKQNNLHLPVSLQCPQFVFDGSKIGGLSLPTGMNGRISAKQLFELSYAPITLDRSGQLEVTLHLQWSAKESVLRKWASFRIIKTETPRLLTEVILENLSLEKNDLHLQSVQPPKLDPYQGYPIYLKGFFMGVEFPVSTTRIENGCVILAHRPGLRVQPGVWYQTRKAVYGIATVNQEKRAFQRYINANRPEPKDREHFVYNPYWSTPTTPSHRQILNVMHTLEEKLYKPYGVTFDSCGLTVFTTDPKSIWKVDKKRFPKGLTDLQEAAARIGSNLDIFFSPCSAYPPALDNVWAKEQGYETFPIPGGSLLCIAGKRYQAETKASIIDMVTRYNAKHVFIDAFWFACPSSDHGHEPGLLSSEPIADGIIDIFNGIRKASPDVWLAPTCFTYNPSPWWAFYVNSMIGTYGSDAPYGRVPCPEYRESYTTARDFYYLQGAYWESTPINVQESFGIIHQSDYPFLNDGVTDILRGNMEQHSAINPIYMNDLRWKQLAELMTWARKNTVVLQDTDVLLPSSWQTGSVPMITSDAVMPREPYGYAHWQSKRSLVMLRNPWIEPQVYPITIPTGLADNGRLSAVSLYPETRVYGEDLKLGDTLQVRLAPYETVVLSFGTHQSIKRVANASKTVCKQIKVTTLKSDVSLVEFEVPKEILSASSTVLAGDAKSGISINLNAEISVDASKCELLVLLEDKNIPIAPISCLKVNGKKVPIIYNGSETGWAATEGQKPEQWLFLSGSLTQGKNQIDLDLTTHGLTPTVSVWVWAKKEGKVNDGGYPNVLPQPEIISLDGVNLLKPVNADSPGIVKKNVPAPIEQIDGVFLDAMKQDQISVFTGSYQANRNAVQMPIVIAGNRYPRGIGTTAPSRLSFTINGKYSRFQSWTGMDSALIANYMDRSNVSFEVWTDGRKRWESDRKRTIDPPDPPEWVDIDITGCKTLELVTVNHDVGGHFAQNWSNWADARLLR